MSAGTTATPPPFGSMPAPAASTAPATINMGDAPADRVLSFEVTVTSIVLSKPDNSTVTAFSGSRRVEVTHLSGKFEPLALTSIPAGTYTKADITVTDPEVVFVDDHGVVQNREDKAFSQTVTVQFNPSLTVGTTPVVLNFDLDAAASVAIDMAAGTVTINPTFKVSAVALGADPPREPEDGEFEHIVGTVTAVNVADNQFTVELGQSGASITFATNTSTRFEIGDSTTGGLAALGTGMLVRVEGVFQSDGTALASEVEAFVANSTGSEAEGIVTSTTGNPVTSFTIVAHDSSGRGASGIVGGSVTVPVDNNSKFIVDNRELSIDGATFPFDASHLAPGQEVEADSESEMEPGDDSGHADMIAARKIKLEQQALAGTVSDFTATANGSRFTLTLAADSAFAKLAGTTSVMVFTEAATELKDGVALPPQSTTTQIRVRGLVFFTGSGYQMIAARVMNP